MTDRDTFIRDRARKLRAEMTPQERCLWHRLRELNRMIAANFRRQAPVGRHIADFAEFGRKLVIELDGGQHGGPEDMARDDWLRTQGFAVLRFWNSEVDGNIEGVMQVILDAMTGEAVPPPQPSPQGGGSAAALRSPDNASPDKNLPSPLWGGAGGGGSTR